MRTYHNKVRSQIGSQPNNGKATFQYSDNRPEATSQRKLQDMADNSTRTKQLKAFQNSSGKLALKETPTFNSNVIQGYFEGKDLAKGIVPADARLSENLKIVKEGKQEVYADPEKIKEANDVLGKVSRIVLKQGDKKDYDLQSAVGQDGLSTISFTDFYQVIPRYNPEVKVEEDTAREQSPEANDSSEEIQNKHDAYVLKLQQLRIDFAALLAVIWGRDGDGIRTWNSDEWFHEVSGWVKADPVRNQVLKLGMQEIAAAYMLDKDRIKRNKDVQSLFLAYSQFMKAEIALKDKVALPTDCAAVVREIVSDGVTVKNDRLDDNPEIGSNYYTSLPKNESNVGWNFHWGGVVLKDGGDNVTLESAGGTSIGSMGKQSWWFQMYGTKNVDQTFKKQIHQTHINRNRTLVDKADSEKIESSHEQLDQHQSAINKWTRLDSDR